MTAAQEKSGDTSAVSSSAAIYDIAGSEENHAEDSASTDKSGSVTDEATNNDNDGPLSPRNTDAGEDALLRAWDPAQEDTTTPSSPGIDYSNVDETPYEHNFQPGDHIIRWDMLPILWPIQIHGIVLEVSEDKSEVTICDFGVTSVKKEDEKTQESETLVEEENAKFNFAIQDLDEGESTTKSEEVVVADDDNKPQPTTENGASPKSMGEKWGEFLEKKPQQRLHVRKLTKWSDLRQWHKVNYEGGLLNAGKGGVGKGLKNLGEKTGKLWTSMTKSFSKNNNATLKDDAKDDAKKAWQSVRYEYDENGYCVRHPDIQLQRKKDDGELTVVRKKCPECITVDCPAMLGKVESTSPKSQATSDNSVSSTGDESKTTTATEVAPDDVSKSEEGNLDKSSSVSGETSEFNAIDNKDSPPKSAASEKSDDESANNDAEPKTTPEPKSEDEKPKSLAEMIAEANKVESKSRLIKTAPSPERKSLENKRASWRGSFMKSMSNILPQKNNKDAPTNVESANEAEEKGKKSEEGGEEAIDTEKKTDTADGLPRSDPPILVLARTRFILEHGENILPPYHIINSNSECISVWCKTGKWSTLQASVFLHSTAIGHAKSATALTLGVAATNPFLIPVFATVGLAAVGTPWLFLKVANDKWAEATMSLNDKFWLQAEPEVFVECIEKWSKIK